MNKHHPLKPEEMFESLGYWSKGHHPPEAFVQAVKDVWDEQIQPARVCHRVIRLVPCHDDDYLMFVDCEPGRGAFPMTSWDRPL